MAILGPYTGDPTKPVSYLYGPHWKGKKGYRVIEGVSNYDHTFGGQKWSVPICTNCNEFYHQIFTFNLNDPKLKELKVDGMNELPLISCLNCSSSWEPQLFSLDVKNKKIKTLSSKDTGNWIQDVNRIPSPLPEIKVHLVEMKDEDIPVDEDTYYNIFDTFGVDYICRLLGAPLYVQFPVDRECPICKNEMQFIATIGSQPYGEVGSVISGVDFFLGEMSLYFLFCKKCMVIKTECQGT